MNPKKQLPSLRKPTSTAGFGGIMHLPYGNIFPASHGHVSGFAIEGVGTKVLIAELIDKYDTIGVDAVAMVVNDVIRSGAKPLAIADNIHAWPANLNLLNAWLKGIIEGANQSDVPSGERRNRRRSRNHTRHHTQLRF